MNMLPRAAICSRKYLLHSVVACMVMLLVGLGLAGCGGTKSTPPAPSVPAPTASLKGAASQITAGQSVVLTWTTTNATSVTVDPSISASALPLSGSASVTPASTTTYKMTATGAGGTATSSFTVNVAAPPAAPTVTLVANPTTITAGSTSTLTWASSNATSVSIAPAVGTAALPLSGTASVTPAATTTYTITAIGAQASVTASATVTVTPVAPSVIPKSAISHIIILMMQNHSFDNLFGTYPLANGLDPTAPSYTQAACGSNVPPCVATSASISPTLFVPVTTGLETPDINHDGVSYPAAFDEGKMDKYAVTNGDVAMQYFDSTSTGLAKDGTSYNVGLLWSYAQQYVLADNFFSAAMNSEPANALYMVAATVHDENTSGKLPFYDNCSAKQGGKIAPALTETNVGDQLNANHISWTWYQANYASSQDGTCVDYVPQENPFQYFTSTQYSANLKDFTLADFTTTLSDGSLPSVVWITPPPVSSMHPGSGDMANGLQWLDNLVKAVQASPAWSSTAIVLLWDESGGWYDHVPPPQLPNTIGLGARVPVIVISPFAKTGVISHQQMDFVSILRFIQWNWGLGTFTDAAQAAREQQTGDLCDLLTSACSSP